MMLRASNAGFSTNSDDKNRCVGASGWQPPIEGCQPPQLHLKQEHEDGTDLIWWGRWDFTLLFRGANLHSPTISFHDPANMDPLNSALNLKTLAIDATQITMCRTP